MRKRISIAEATQSVVRCHGSPSNVTQQSTEGSVIIHTFWKLMLRKFDHLAQGTTATDRQSWQDGLIPKARLRACGLHFPPFFLIFMKSKDTPHDSITPKLSGEPSMFCTTLTHTHTKTAGLPRTEHTSVTITNV